MNLLRELLGGAASAARGLVEAALHGDCAKKAEDAGRERDATVSAFHEQHGRLVTATRLRVATLEREICEVMKRLSEVTNERDACRADIEPLRRVCAKQELELDQIKGQLRDRELSRSRRALFKRAGADKKDIAPPRGKKVDANKPAHLKRRAGEAKRVTNGLTSQKYDEAPFSGGVDERWSKRR